MIEMKVSALSMDPFTNMPILLLKDETGQHALPIWVGLIEASAIVTELEEIHLARPMTHDLIRDILGKVGAHVDRVEVTDVHEDTFFAQIHLRTECAGKTKRFSVDARPSDAIALALRTGAPILVFAGLVVMLGLYIPPPLETLLRSSDIVSLHTPYLPATHHLMDRKAFALMKQGALLINTARGGLVDTNALVWALDEGIVGGAGLDVLEGEDLVKEERQLLSKDFSKEKLATALRNHILLHRENVVITPHIAFDSREALQRILETTAGNITSFLAGHPVNVVPVGTKKR